MSIPLVNLNNGVKMPAIGFGTWQILLNGRAKKAVLTALDAGYRLFDTAKIYGNEKGVGSAIRESGINRENIFVTTKLWNSDQGYENTLKAFDKSLSRLGLDHIDLYLIHWPAGQKRIDSWHALEEIYKSGKARAIGVSNFTINHLEELFVKCTLRPMVNQIEFHPFLYSDQKELVKYCQKKGIVIEAYSPLARAERMKDAVIERIANGHARTNAQVMLRWAIQHGTVPLPKSSHPGRINENLDVFDFELSSKEMESINALSSGTRTTWDPSDIQ